MSSLISKALSSSSRNSQPSRPLPDREDRYVLEQARRHVGVRYETIIRGVRYNAEYTSLSRSASNPVAKAQMILQTIENLDQVKALLEQQLYIVANVFTDMGTLYDREFPTPLREWILKRRRARRVETEDSLADDVDDAVFNGLISQLIFMRTIRSEW